MLLRCANILMRLFETAKMGDVDYAITFDKKQAAAFRDSGINVEKL